MSLAKLRARLQKQYAEGLVDYEEESRKRYTRVSTGSLALDVVLGGGWVQGRLHEINGIPSVGKSSLMLASMAEQQKAYPDKAVCYIDMEQTFDPDWAELFGVELLSDRFIHLYPEHAEDVSDMLKEVLMSNEVSCVVIDSIGGMESMKAFEKNAADAIVGKSAQVITRMLKNAAVQARKHDATVLFVNQLRANIGAIMGGDISAGPKSLPYSVSTKVKLTRGGNPPRKIREDGADVPVAHEVRCKIEKCKVYPAEGKVATFYLVTKDSEKYGPVGIDRLDEAVNVGIRTGAIIQSGAYYTMPNGERIKSRDSVVEAMEGDPALVELVREKAISLMEENKEEGKSVSPVESKLKEALEASEMKTETFVAEAEGD